LFSTTSGQEMERVNSYNPGARTGLESMSVCRFWPKIRAVSTLVSLR